MMEYVGINFLRMSMTYKKKMLNLSLDINMPWENEKEKINSFDIKFKHKIVKDRKNYNYLQANKKKKVNKKIGQMLEKQFKGKRIKILRSLWKDAQLGGNHRNPDWKIRYIHLFH